MCWARPGLERDSGSDPPSGDSASPRGAAAPLGSPTKWGLWPWRPPMPCRSLQEAPAAGVALVTLGWCRGLSHLQVLKAGSGRGSAGPSAQEALLQLRCCPRRGQSGPARGSPGSLLCCWQGAPPPAPGLSRRPSLAEATLCGAHPAWLAPSRDEGAVSKTKPPSFTTQPWGAFCWLEAGNGPRRRVPQEDGSHKS